MEVSVIVGIAGLVLASATFFVGRTTAATTSGKQYGAFASDLGYVKSNTDEIKRRLDKTDERYTEMVIAQAEIRRDVQTAFVRIDEIKEDVKTLKLK